jgi:hypothetical protein
MLYGGSSLPYFISFDDSTRYFTFNSFTGIAGSYTIQVTGTVGSYSAASATFILTELAVCSSATISSSSTVST